MPRQFYNYDGDRLGVSKIEFKAMRWAANYLIPKDNLLDVISSGLYEHRDTRIVFFMEESVGNLPSTIKIIPRNWDTNFKIRSPTKI